jgi:hypothetical protein
MAKWSVYFDDSGTHSQSDIAVAACYVAPASQWLKFQRAWSKAAEQEGFRVFHMAEFNARQGDFKGWDDPKRERVIRKLVAIIRRCTTHGIALGLPKSDYDAVMPADLKKKMGNHHYSWCVKLCFGEIEKWRDRCSLTAPMAYVFEKGTRGATGELIDALTKYAKTQADALRRYGLETSGFSFQKKDDAVQLQAADILAWETCHQMRNVVFAASPRTRRKSYSELRRDDHAQVYYIRRHQIEKWVTKTRELEATGQSAFSI